MGVIALKSRNAFLARERQDYREYKKLTEAQLEQKMLALPAKPPIYYKLTHPQKVSFIIGAETRSFCFFLDTGCLDGSTLLDTSKGKFRIDELEEAGEQINVLSRTNKGLEYVPASAPFRRGPTALYQVEFVSGKKMVVTGKHRFLTFDGFCSCERLLIGQSLPVFESSPYLTTLGICPSGFPQDAPHSSQIIQDLKDRYYQYHHPYDQYHHPYDEQLPRGLDTDQVLIQQFCGKEVQNHFFLHTDGLGTALSNTLFPFLPSELELADCGLFSSNYRKCPVYEFDLELFGSICHKIQLKMAVDSQQEQAVLNLALAQESFQQESRLFDNPSAFSTSHDSIHNIRYLRTDYYYDLHVPVYENYIAEGFCHHNTGKTLLIIALIRYFRLLGLIQHALILVPGRSNKTEWKDELLKHSPKSSCLTLPSSIEDKWTALEQSNDLFVVESYAGLFRMVTKKATDKKNKNYLELDPKKIKMLQKHFQAFACDESENVGNHVALPFRICRQLAKTSIAKFTMTGTPFNRDPSTLWSQMFLVDGGHTLGETLGLFRSIFCNETENFFSGMPEYKFNKKKQTLLNDFIANRSIEYEADQASLPACVPVKKYVALDTDAMTYYETFKEQLVASRGNFIEAKSAFIRMRQISSGFVGYEDDETGEKARFEFPENPKLELLMSIIKGTRDAYKIIVFFEFTYSGEKILAELKKSKIGATIIYGKTKDTDAAKKEFMDNPKKRILLLQTRMAAGMNVQVAKYSIFYESPVSAIKRKQCARRVVRQHSSHKTVFEYDLVMRGGVDEQILDFHKEGESLFEAIIRGNAVAK